MNPEQENKNSKLPPKPDLHKKDKEDLFIRPLRTYEDDVKDAVQIDGVTTAKIMMAEQQRQQREQAEVEEVSVTSKTNIFKLSLSFILIAAGVGAIGYAIYYFQPFKAKENNPTIVLAPNEFVDREELVEINKTNKTNREVISAARDEIKNSQSMRLDTLKELELLKTIEVTAENKTYSENVQLTSAEFLNILEARQPDALTRSLDKKFMLGVHKRKDSVSPFIIFKIADYELAYANMLLWERILVSDVQDIFFQTLGSSQVFQNDEIQRNMPVINAATGTNAVASTTTATSTKTVATSTAQIATSTPAATSTGQVVTTPIYNPRDFRDIILNNEDTRAIVDKDGILLFFYSFIDKEHLVMADNIETLNILINRINSAKLIR